MKRTIAILGVALIGSPVLMGQEQRVDQLRRELEVMTQAAGARLALETRVTRGKPYSAEAVTEFVQVLGDGNRIVRKTSARIARDSEGRTRREELATDGPVEKSSISITDSSSWRSKLLA